VSIADLQARINAIRAAAEKPKEKAAAKPKPKIKAADPQRQWQTLALVTRVGQQQCCGCGATHRYIAGRYAYQRSGSIYRHLLVGHFNPAELPALQLIPLQVEELPIEVVQECPTCLGIGEHTIDAMIASFTAKRQLTLWEI
jgi:hypothetical protein